MNITVNKSSIRTIKQGEDNFLITDGLVCAPRAGFEVDINCPREYKLIIADCIDRGWIKPVAHVRDHEMFWEALSQ